MIVLAIDPGTVQSGWVRYCTARGFPGNVDDSGVLPNADVLRMVVKSSADMLALEMVASYGMAVGREVFETVVWIGRFQQAWHSPEDVRKVYRKDVKSLLCHTQKANDSNIRQALLDLYPRTGGGKTPQIGTKAQPGPLYGVSSHAWPALGVAMAALAASTVGTAKQHLPRLPIEAQMDPAEVQF